MDGCVEGRQLLSAKIERVRVLLCVPIGDDQHDNLATTVPCHVVGENVVRNEGQASPDGRTSVIVRVCEGLNAFDHAF